MWTLVDPPIDCNLILVRNENDTPIVVREIASDPDTEVKIARGDSVPIGGSSLYSGPTGWNDPRFLIGQVVFYARLTAGLGSVTCIFS